MTQLKSITTGFLIAIILTILFITILRLYTPYNWLVGLLTFTLIFLGGLSRVSIAHKGVVIFIGTRLRSLFLSEGWNWTFPILTSVQEIDVREQSTIVISFTAISQNGVRVTIDASIQWAIENPYLALSVTENVINKGMPELVRQALRISISAITADIALTDVQEKIKTALSNNINLEAGKWGLKIKTVLISNVALPEIVIADYERTAREEQQRAAERIESQHVREQIKLFMEELGMTQDEARRTFQIERGKIEEKIQRFQIGIEPGFRDAVIEAIRQFLSK